MKITFITDVGGLDQWMYEISKSLEIKLDIDSHFIALQKRNKDFLLTKHVDFNKIVFFDYMKFSKKPNLEFIRISELKYGFKVWDIWNINRQRSKKREHLSNEKILSWFEYYIRAFERYFSEFKPDFILLHGPANFAMVLMYKIAHFFNIEIIELVSSRIPNRFGITNSINSNWPVLDGNFNLFNSQKLNRKDLKIAKKFISDFVTSSSRPDCVGSYSESKFKIFLRLLPFFKIYINNRTFPDLKPLFWKFKSFFYNLLPFWDSPNLSKKYVYLPLHFQPEVTTSLYGKWYENQLNIIDLISKSLPFDYVLYVKDHFYRFGRRPISFYKQIKNHTNVKLLHPSIDSHKLIKNSSLVLTVTGTAAMEALFYGKNSIIFGDVFFSISNLVFRIHDPSNLPLVIQKTFNSTFNYDHLYKFVIALLNSSYEGLAVLPGDCANYSLKPDNINKLSEGIITYLKQVRKLN